MASPLARALAQNASSDVIAKLRALPPFKAGDAVSFLTALDSSGGSRDGEKRVVAHKVLKVAPETVSRHIIIEKNVEGIVAIAPATGSAALFKSQARSLGRVEYVPKAFLMQKQYDALTSLFGEAEKADSKDGAYLELFVEGEEDRKYGGKSKKKKSRSKSLVQIKKASASPTSPPPARWSPASSTSALRWCALRRSTRVC